MTLRRPAPASLAALFEELAGRPVADQARLEAAFTHASARGSISEDYQRLEFLGDRVLGLAVADLLYEKFPNATEGELSLRLNALVRAETIAEVAEEVGLSAHIRASGTVEGKGSRKAINLRSDVMEALIAVIYLEGGLEAAEDFVRRHWEPRVSGDQAPRRDPKTALQEWAHQTKAAAPRYVVESRTGPDHAPRFTVSVHVEGIEQAGGTGRSKREAEQAAATELLKREGAWDER